MHLSSVITSLVIVLLFGLCTVHDSYAQSVKSNKYIKTFVKDINYGEHIDNVGMLSIQDHFRSGPESFAHDAEGNIYICDTVNRSIKVYSTVTNDFLSIPLADVVEVNDVALDRHGNIYVYDDRQGKLFQYSKNGILHSTISVDLKEMTSKGELHIVYDNIYIRNSSQQEDVLVGRIDSGFLKRVSQKDSPTIRHLGIHSLSGKRYLVSLQRMKKGEITVLNSEGSVIKSIDLPLKGLVSILFLQEDKKGNFYIQTERLENNKIVLEVHKYSASGSHDDIIPILDNDYRSFVIKLVSIDEQGKIYQFVPKAEKGQVIIRSPE